MVNILLTNRITIFITNFVLNMPIFDIITAKLKIETAKNIGNLAY